MLVGPLLLIATEDEMLARSLGRRVVAAMFGSTGDTYSFAVCEPDGTRRHLVDSMGRREVDDGEALPQEEGVELLTEDTTQALLAGVTGVDVWAHVVEQDWEVLESEGDPSAAEPGTGAYPGVAEPTHDTGQRTAEPPPRKGFFARLLGR
ncbi:hypothetical protein [Serinicoccus kebangsaanensis]|uniref:hypothetical protein n=1 Tax=Serinicoccus kebangsaanensis TaxID=2602069 RepID=UPI00124F70E1|nr:hypothetical protein [Serinicoccus kebangsaanensis]